MELQNNPEYLALLKQQANLEAEMAYTRGQADQARVELLNDSELVEVLRAKAWRQAGNTDVRIVDGRPVGHPEGWPDGVDPDEVMEKHVDSQMPKPTQPNNDDESSDSEFVQQFRERINHATD